MTTLQVLKKARALIKKGWTQQWWAEDRKGNIVTPDDPAAVKFCLRGAIRRVHDAGEEAALAAIVRANHIPKATSPALYGGAAAEWNDRTNRTQAEVLAAFDKAIKAVSK